MFGGTYICYVVFNIDFGVLQVCIRCALGTGVIYIHVHMHAMYPVGTVASFWGDKILGKHQ